MKKVFISALSLLWATLIAAQVVNIPDANFKEVLVDDSSINTNKDAEIQVSEAVVYTGKISVFNREIVDLTGIEAFVNITKLDCNSNFIKTLDVSKKCSFKRIRLQSKFY